MAAQRRLSLEGKRVVVVGLGKSGVAAARLCLRLGARVAGADRKPLEQLPPEVADLGIELFTSGYGGVDFAAADGIVVSPGVPSLPEIVAAERAGVPVIGELELAVRALRNQPKILCVGGTNGKSTTTMLLGRIMEKTVPEVFIGGNLGTPLSSQAERAFDAIVLEVSSFQLERAPTFRPHVGILLNVTEDHLDRYASFAAYADAKGNAFVNQREQDVALIPAGDARCEAQARRGRGRIWRFGTAAPADYLIEGQAVHEAATGVRFDLEHVPLHGGHNLQNAAAAIAAARAAGATPAQVRDGLAGFVPLRHRMALAGELSGVRFYDDSKATNVGAAVTALAGLREPKAVLIAGGRDKLGSYAALVDALVAKGRAAVLIGEAAERIAVAMGGRLKVVRAGGMEEAVRAAFELAEPGDAVLLSPACSSFDMFESYAERGDVFCRAVAELRRTCEEKDA